MQIQIQSKSKYFKSLQKLDSHFHPTHLNFPIFFLALDLLLAVSKRNTKASFLQQLDSVQRVSRAVDTNSHLSSDAKRRISAFLEAWLRSEQWTRLGGSSQLVSG